MHLIKWCKIGNQDGNLAHTVLFLLCFAIIALLEVVSSMCFDDFTQLNEDELKITTTREESF